MTRNVSPCPKNLQENNLLQHTKHFDITFLTLPLCNLPHVTSLRKYFLSAEECKRRWKLLRDGYRRANLKKTKSGQATIFVKPWKFEKQMAFLHPTFQDRPQVSNLGSSATQMVEDDDEVDVEKVLDDNVREPSQFEQQTPHTAGGTPTDPSPISDTVVPSPSGSTSSLYKRKAVRQLSAGEVLQNYLATKREEKQKELRPTDQLSKFFSAMEETVRQLPVDLQLNAKISNILYSAGTRKEGPRTTTRKSQLSHTVRPSRPTFSTTHPQPAILAIMICKIKTNPVEVQNTTVLPRLIKL